MPGPDHSTAVGSYPLWKKENEKGFLSKAWLLNEEGFSPPQSTVGLARVWNQTELSPNLFFATTKSVTFISVLGLNLNSLTHEIKIIIL